MANDSRMGAFIPLTRPWEIGELEKTDVKSKEFKDLLNRLHRFVNQIALAVNDRTAGFYPLTEFVNGESYYPNPSLSSQTQQDPVKRQIYIKTIPCGQLTTKSVAHGLNVKNTWQFIYIEGTSSDNTDLTYIPLPYASNTPGKSVEINVNAVNINITTGVAWPNYTLTDITLKWITS